MDKNRESDGEIRHICGDLNINASLSKALASMDLDGKAAVIKADATAAIKSVAETGDTTSSVSNATSDQGTVNEEEDATKLMPGASTSFGSETSKEGLDDAQQIEGSGAAGKNVNPVSQPQVDAVKEEEKTEEAVRQQLVNKLKEIRRDVHGSDRIGLDPIRSDPTNPTIRNYE